MGCRTGPPGYLGWRNRFLGIDFWVFKSLKIRAQDLFFSFGGGTGSGFTSLLMERLSADYAKKEHPKSVHVT
jgi:hypothetical protein